jgi:hypothetical protein
MFRRTGYKMMLLCAVTLSTATMSSCINESDAGCVQYAAKPYLVGSDGTVHSDAAVKSIMAYLFSDGKFDHTLSAESDGRFLVSFDGTKTTTLVMFGYPDNDSLSVNVPKEGEDIENVSSSVLKTRGNLSPAGFYCGRYDYTPTKSDTLNKEVSVKMQSERATVKVVVENLISKYGSGGSYTIELSGLRSTVGFDGAIGGDSITYTPQTAFDSKSNLCSEAVNTLPTKKDESVTVNLYRNGMLLWKVSEDSQNNSITLSGGDNKTVVIDVMRMTVALFSGSGIDDWNNIPGNITAE